MRISGVSSLRATVFVREIVPMADSIPILTTTHSGAVVVITNRGGSRFLFRRIPADYPVEAARGRLAAIGGKFDPKCDTCPEDAILRHIRQKIVHRTWTDLTIRRLVLVGTFPNVLPEWNRIEMRSVFLSRFSTKEFDEFEKALKGHTRLAKDRRIFREGDPVFMGDDELSSILREGYDGFAAGHVQFLWAAKALVESPYRWSAVLR